MLITASTNAPIIRMLTHIGAGKKVLWILLSSWLHSWEEIRTQNLIVL